MHSPNKLNHDSFYALVYIVCWVLKSPSPIFTYDIDLLFLVSHNIIFRFRPQSYTGLINELQNFSLLLLWESIKYVLFFSDILGDIFWRGYIFLMDVFTFFFNYFPNRFDLFSSEFNLCCFSLVCVQQHVNYLWGP